MQQHRQEITEWDKRLREDEASRRAKAAKTGADYVAGIYTDHYRESFDHLSGTQVVTWVAYQRNGFLFDPIAHRNQKLTAEELANDPHSARDRAGRADASGDLGGDSLGGDLVPMPRPKIDQSRRRRVRPAAFDHPFLLRASFYAACYAELGYVGLKTGKGKKPAKETAVLRNFLRRADSKGWPQTYLVWATRRSKSNVALHVSAARTEDMQRGRLLDSLTQPAASFPKTATESNLAWCSCRTQSDEDGTSSTHYTASDGATVEYTRSSAWTWRDVDVSGSRKRTRTLYAERCSRCYGLISKTSADPARRRTDASKGRSDDPALASPLFAGRRDRLTIPDALEEVSIDDVTIQSPYDGGS